MLRKILKITLPILILAGAVFAFRSMLDSRQPPKKIEREEKGALVRVTTVELRDRTIVVEGHGEVQPLSEASISPQVSGRIVEVDTRFRAGGFFRAGEKMFGIERVDYELALEEARAEVTRAEFELEEVRSKARVARQQWDKLAESDFGRRSKALADGPNPLALYRPQLKNAQARLEAAKAAVKRARLDLSRTRIEAPFNCLVRSESVDPGQYVRSGEPVATVMGTDAVEVVVPLTFEELERLRVPRPGSPGTGSKAVVSLQVGRNRYEWEGSAVRRLGELDAKARLVRVVVRIEDPYGLESGQQAQRPSLAVGTFVDVELYGDKLESVIALPRSALRENSTVWLVTQDDRLRVQPVEWAWSDERVVFVTSGLSGGERVVLTTLNGAVDGMALRPVEDRVQVAEGQRGGEKLP
jgi:RND family efflux transporter MFP subunit